MSSVLFVSTNGEWSGSEELWVRSAKVINEAGNKVSLATRFDHPMLNSVSGERFIYATRYKSKSILKRGIEYTRLYKFADNDLLKNYILSQLPRLVVISQGNNFEAFEIMKLCVDMQLPFVTISQLVSDFFIFIINDNLRILLRNVYNKALKNYFVSNQNMHLNNFLLNTELSNAEVVYNPCKVTSDKIPAYPEFDSYYRIALVGRIECWHKGYDLMLKIISQPKWQERKLVFNLYGEGTHKSFIAEYILNNKLNNIQLKGHVSHVNEIWRENQMLFMPSRMEGQALALIEAMWCERPAVVTNVGGASELIDEGISGYIANNVTVGDIDAALERAWDNRHNWQKMGIEAAKALNEKHPADAVKYFSDKVLQQISILQ